MKTMEDIYMLVLGGAILVAVVVGFITKTYPLRTVVFILLLAIAKPIAVNVGGFLCNLTPSGCHRDGRDGINGKDGLNGQSGNEGKDGQLGKDGATGLAGEQGKGGKDGLDGQRGQDGKDGLNGKDGATASPSVLLSTGSSSAPIAVGATKPRFAAVKISGNSSAVTVRLFDNAKREWLDEDTHKVKPEPDLGETIVVDDVQAIYVGAQVPDHDSTREESAQPSEQRSAFSISSSYEPTLGPDGAGAQENAGIPPVASQDGQVSAQQLQDADAELNRVYQNLRSRLNAAQKEQLKSLQRQWIQNRDAAMNANPANARVINYQATVERTARLKQVISGGAGAQAIPGARDGTHYRMSATEMIKQMRAVEPILKAITQAEQRGDTAAAAEKIRELIQTYPMCPTTLVMQMGIAFNNQRFDDATVLYNTLMTEYPDQGGMRETTKQIYQRMQQKYGNAK